LVALALGASDPNVLTFSLVDIVSPKNSSRISDLSNAGYEMALLDAQSGKFGLFPNHTLVLSRRMMQNIAPTDPDMMFTLVDALREDDPVGLFGPCGDDAALAAATIATPLMLPQVTIATDSAERVLDGTYRETFIKLFPGWNHRSYAVLSWLKSLGYQAVGVLTQATRVYTSMSTIFSRNARILGINVITTAIIQPEVNGQFDVQSILGAEKQSHIRVFVAICDTSAELTNILRDAKIAGILGEGYIWVNLGLSAFASTEQRVLAIDAGLFSVAVTRPNTTSQAYQDFQTRIRDTLLPNQQSYPSYDPNTEALSAITVYAYDAAMIFLRALNSTVANGVSPYNRSYILDEVQATDFVGVTGHVKYLNDRVLSGSVDINQMRNEGFVTVSHFDFFSRILTDINPVLWPGNASNSPPNFTPDSCGSLYYRSDNGTCLTCGNNLINDPTDGIEQCSTCPLGTQLLGSRCIQCDSGTVSELENGIPRCKVKSPSSKTAVVIAVTFSVAFGTMLMLGAGYKLMKLYKGIRHKFQLAQQKAKDEERFVAFVFHEIRNPLNGVVGSLEFIEDVIRKLMTYQRKMSGQVRLQAERRALASENLKQSLRSCLQDIHACMSCTAHTMDILNSVLDLSKISHGKLKLIEHPVCLRTTAEMICMMLSRANPSLQIQSRVTYNGRAQAADENLHILADSKRLKQVLLNLLLNAVQHTTSGFAEILIDIADSSTVFESPAISIQLDPDSSPPPALILASIPSTPTPSGTITPTMSQLTTHSSPNHHRRFSLAINFPLTPRSPSSNFSLHLSHTVASTSPTVQTSSSSNFLPPSTNVLSKLVEVKVQVRDSGECITAEAQRKLFDLYGQAAMGTSANGTGLGLVLSKQFVELMGGELKVDSPWTTEHSGSCFHFSFKAKTSPPPEHDLGSVTNRQSDVMFPMMLQRSFHESGPIDLTLPDGETDEEEPQHVLNNIRVLIVDDILMNRRLLKRKLQTGEFEKHKMRIEEVETGEQCLELVIGKQIRFDLIFMDQIMSNAGGQLLGHEVTSKIRDWECDQNIPPCDRGCIITCSGNSSMEDVRLYSRSGSNWVLPKPLPEQSQFYATLTEWLGQFKSSPPPPPPPPP
jgi:signal transduction histidine kinase/ABC-type branched-subunit amino acid transport system substrate-binding protein